MIRAWVHAHALRALFSRNAVIAVTTGSPALSLIANITATVQICVTNAILSHASVLSATEGGLKAQWAVANGFTVHYLAQGIWSTCRLTRVHATAVQASRVLGTILIAIRAHALGTASGGVRVSHLICGTLADMSIRSGFTNGGRMTGILIATVQSDTLNFRQRIWTISRGALAHGTMVIGNADSVISTGFLIAHIVARVRQSVAQLRCRAVNVIHARHTATSIGLVVWIAGKWSRRALALCVVVIRDADGMWAALDLITGRATTHNAIVTDTGFRFGTLGMRRAFATQLRATSISVVRIASVTTQAVATALMVLGNAHGVSGAGELKAHGDTLGHSQNIWTASGDLVAIIIGLALGQRGPLTTRGHCVPHKLPGTLTDGVVLRIQLALFILTTRDSRARIDTSPETSSRVHSANLSTGTLTVLSALSGGLSGFWFASSEEVTGISKVTLGTDARGSVVVGDAQGVGSTLYLTAGIHALPDATAVLEADLLVVAIRVVRALALYSTSIDHVLGISRVPRRTDALARVTCRPWATLNTIAEVLAAATVTRVSYGTVHLGTASTPRWVIAVVQLCLGAHREGVSVVARLATAIVATRGIDAHGTLSTGQARALVDVEALNVRIAIESGWAHTIELIESFSALGGNSTRVRFTFGLLLGTASFIRISGRSSIAHALVAAESVLTVGIVTALGMALRSDRGRHTE